MSETIERAKNSNMQGEYSRLGSRCMISRYFVSPCFVQVIYIVLLVIQNLRDEIMQINAHPDKEKRQRKQKSQNLSAQCPLMTRTSRALICDPPRDFRE